MRPPKRFLILMAVLMTASLAACEKNAPAANFGLGSGAGNFPPGSQQEFNGKIGDTVRFETDSPELTPEGRSILNAQAVWLRQYSNYPITIEGHADERGTRVPAHGQALARINFHESAEKWSFPQIVLGRIIG